MSEPTQPKEYYEKVQGCQYKSGMSDGAERIIDWEVLTDNAQGIKFCTDGAHFQLNYKTSYDMCGQDCAKGEPAKIIRAKNGDIHLDAMNGDIYLKAANIRLQAVDAIGEVTIVAGKQVAVKSAIVNTSATKNTQSGTQDASTTGTTVNTHGKLQNTNSSATDEKQASFLGQIMAAIKKFKKLLECAS